MRRLVIVEDDADTVELLCIQLGTLGFDCRTADAGQSGIELIYSFQPDAAVIDLGLPDMTGFELARRVRAVDKDLRLIALTGRSEPSARERAIEAGFDAFLVKPATVAALQAALR
jgi:DNA-binding response OmpR family regulator